MKRAIREFTHFYSEDGKEYKASSVKGKKVIDSCIGDILRTKGLVEKWKVMHGDGRRVHCVTDNIAGDIYISVRFDASKEDLFKREEIPITSKPLGTVDTSAMRDDSTCSREGDSSVPLSYSSSMEVEAVPIPSQRDEIGKPLGVSHPIHTNIEQYPSRATSTSQSGVVASVLGDLSLNPAHQSKTDMPVCVGIIEDNSIFYDQCGYEDKDHGYEYAQIVYDEFLDEWKDVYSQVGSGGTVHCRVTSRKDDKISFSFSTKNPNDTGKKTKKTKRRKKVKKVTGESKMTLEERIRKFTHFISYERTEYTKRSIVLQCVDDIACDENMLKKWKKLHGEKKDVYCMVKDLDCGGFLALYLAGTIDELFKETDESSVPDPVDEYPNYSSGTSIRPLSASECMRRSAERCPREDTNRSDSDVERGTDTTTKHEYSSLEPVFRLTDDEGCPCCKSMSSPTHSQVPPSLPTLMKGVDKELIGIVSRLTHFYRAGGARDSSVETVASCSKDIVGNKSLLQEWEKVSEAICDVYCLFMGVGKVCTVMGLYETLDDLRADEGRVVGIYEKAVGKESEEMKELKTMERAQRKIFLLEYLLKGISVPEEDREDYNRLLKDIEKAGSKEAFYDSDPDIDSFLRKNGYRGDSVIHSDKKVAKGRKEVEQSPMMRFPCGMCGSYSPWDTSCDECALRASIEDGRRILEGQPLKRVPKTIQAGKGKKAARGKRR